MTHKVCGERILIARRSIKTVFFSPLVSFSQTLVISLFTSHTTDRRDEREGWYILFYLSFITRVFKFSIEYNIMAFDLRFRFISFLFVALLFQRSTRNGAVAAKRLNKPKHVLLCTPTS